MPIQPFIFVGVGGTGGKTLGYIRRTLDDTLSRIGWQEGWPEGWQFIHIDVPAEPDANSADTPYALPRTSYVPLTTTRSTYQSFHESISRELIRSSADETGRYLAWGSWHPEPASAVFVHIPHGAGQYRAIGRVCVLKSLKLVDQAFARAHAAATLADTSPQLQRVQRLVTGERPTAGDVQPVIFVIGSVSGGSGSGMFLDVCDVLRGQGHEQINSLLFTPEVFERSNGDSDPGVAPNTFMALNEVANSMWVHAQADAPLSRDRLFARAGVSSPVGRGGPSTVFLVGRKNRSVTFKDADEVYKIVGRSLGELVLDEKLTSDVVAYDFANSHALTAGVPDSLDLTPPDAPARDLALFRGLGFSRLTVGREFFDRYATDRLLRRIGRRLLEGHLERRLPDDLSSDDELRLAVAKEAWPAFLRDCDLDEVGRNNALTDKLDTWNHAEVTAARNAFTTKLRNDIAATDKKQIVATDARLTAQTNVKNAREVTSEFTAHIVKASRELALGLQQEIQQTLQRVIVRSIASYGLPVTIDLVDRLIERSREGVQSLDGERGYVSLKLQDLLAALPQPPAGSPARFPKASVDDINAIVDDAERALRKHTQVFAQDLAQDLLDDLTTNLLESWRRALSDVNGLLGLELRPDVGMSPLELWPADLGVPDYLQPSKVEFLLDGVDGFPDQFVDVIERSVSGDKGLNAVITATEQIIAGEELGVRATTRPVGLVERGWIPRSELARPSGKNPAAATIAVTLELADLKSRTYAWLTDQEKFVGKFLRQSIGDYLTDELVSAPERKLRQERLVGHFQSMMTSSLPLVALDSRLTTLLHGQEVPPYSLHVSNVNVPDQLGDLRQQIKDAAAAVLGTQLEVQFTNTPAPMRP
ncbi:tubulin-like doman-containing protein (plasmid) [Mycolicibacterium aichiense]|uniref:tubulin-like doman-containing protein n=1 Tax=Mycolicibacterium aichiense TaxID=1799 RepID=UPI003D665B00